MLETLVKADNALLLLLVFVPIAIVLELMHASAVAIFAASSIAIIPLAGLMGRSSSCRPADTFTGPTRSGSSRGSRPS